MNSNFLQMFSSGEAQAAEAAEADSSCEAKDAEGEFEALIKGKYRDEYHRRVQSVIDKRFSKMKTMEGALESYAPLMERIAEDFPHIEKSDTDGLIRAFLEKSNSPAGKSNNRLNSAFIEALEGRMKMSAAMDMKASFLRDAEALRNIYPSFDLQRELSSTPEMKNLILAGVGLRQAYEVTHLDVIMSSALRWAMMKASRDTAQQLAGNARIAENSLSGRAAATRHKNVNSLTEKDIREILSDVQNGKKVTF